MSTYLLSPGDLFRVKEGSIDISHTLAVLNTTDLQSGRILTDHAGRSYDTPWKVTVLSFVPQLAKNAAHVPLGPWYT
jgi:hypothetical protein